MSEQAAGPAAGEAVELEVERIAYGGDGVGRSDGLVVFVPWTAPGERVRARIVERHPRYARARLEGVLAAAEARVEPGCPLFGVCGGCQLQHLDRVSQLESKARAVADAFERIAGMPLSAPLECEPAAQPWHYRRRATFTWRRSEGVSVLGFHAAEGPGDIVDVEVCPICAEPGNVALVGLRDALASAPALDGNAPEEARVAVRALPGQAVQAGFFCDSAERARELAGHCAAQTGLSTTWGARGGVAAPFALAAGAPRLATRIEIGGLRLRVGFDSFLQADPVAAARLYDAVEESLAARPGDRVVDGYAGIGALTCRLSLAGVRVTAVEAHAGAASDLRANAAAAGGEPVHVLELPAERVDWRRPRPDGVVLNPPRSGCAPAVLDSIARSRARRIVYVSCDPTTLARDVRRLGGAWRLDTIRVFDLFPQTAHVETVVSLSRERNA